MTTIAFVRHGITDWNIKKRAQGHSNNPLNEIGRRQARSVAKRLSDEKWDVIVSSDLLRARETAEIISSYIGKPITFDKRLREIGLGEIQGTTEEERIQKWGKIWRQLDLGVETDQSLGERGIAFVEAMARKYPGKRIIAVSHGIIIGQTLKELFQSDTRDNNLNNTSVTIITKSKGAWRYLLYNCTCHLKTELINEQ
ncbi:histidine phosphatase family protein [Novibacillus thermophilus]|uniref:Histidine phosphatase family protein n=1 Tax=Novibacillus thermophilus TaxID=1471761 RepID=A0A1U9K8V2_9BACL|nr:histidine phosphatase family protein [Novibacillus thermophilus]AQS56451.1 hypothetical protein B0W44_12465 [Novibacillus thermophilus]